MCTRLPAGVDSFKPVIKDEGVHGLFYPKREMGRIPHCAGCEAFYKEDELVDGQCPFHPTREIEWTNEDN